MRDTIRFRRWVKGVRIHKVRGRDVWLLVDHSDRGDREFGSLYFRRGGKRSAVRGEFDSLADAQKERREWIEHARKEDR